MRHADYVTAIAKSSNAYGYHFGAIIFDRRNIVSTGWCQTKTHPKQARFMQRFAPLYKRNNTFLHAEVHALVAAKQSVMGYEMVIARWSENRLKTSRPCDACHQAITVSGINKIWFWNEQKNNWECCRI